MTPEEGFESAQQLAAWADSQLGELKNEVLAFFDTDPCTMVKEINPKTGRAEAKIRIQKTPYRIRGMTGDIIKNLRDALDQAVNAASHLVLGKQNRDTHFPFGMSPDDFDKAVTLNKCKHIPAVLRPILKGYEPYYTGDDWDGGNDCLKMLGVISGPHKHRFTLRTEPIIPQVEISDFDINFGRGGGAVLPGFDKNGDYVLASFGPGGHAYFKQVGFPLRIAFSDPKLKGAEIGSFLGVCRDSVAHIVQDLQTQAFALVSK